MVRHPLQPFSRRYFSGTDVRLCSFAAEYCRAAQAREAGVRTRHAFLPDPLPSADFGPASISLLELSRYLQHPVRWFLENRLGLFLQEKSRELQDREPIHLDALEKYQLSRDLLAMKGEGLSRPEILLARWRGEGRVPLGQGAQAVFAEIRETVRPIVEQLLAYETGEALPPLRREIALSPEITLHGELGGRYPSGHLYWTNSLLHGRILLPVWLEHLFLSAVAPDDQRCETIVIGRGRDKGYRPGSSVLAGARGRQACCSIWPRLFADGFNAPLPFFPKSGLVFAQAMASGKGTEEERRITAFARAEEEYLGNDFAPGEGDDPYCRQLFGDALPVSPGYALYREGNSPAFAELATRIFTAHAHADGGAMSRAFDPLLVASTGVQLIEASAGTGKTYSITSLYLRLLLERRLSVEQILVVTFTEAATAELHERIRARLRSAVLAFENQQGGDDPFLGQLLERSADPEADRRLLARAVSDIDKAAVSTIHGFAHRVLQQHALETGLLFELELTGATEVLVREITDDYWSGFFYDLDHRLASLVRQGVSPAQLRALTQEAIRHGDFAIVGEIPAPEEDIRLWCRSIADAMPRPGACWQEQREALARYFVQAEGLTASFKTLLANGLLDRLADFFAQA